MLNAGTSATIASPMIAISFCNTCVTGVSQQQQPKTACYSSTDCQKLVETKRSTYSCAPTVLRSNSHPTSSNDKVGLGPPSPALPADWDSILFSDECWANLSNADGRERVYRSRGKRFADACVIEWDSFGGGSV